MEKKSSQKTKPKTRKLRFNLNNAPKIETVSLAGDLSGCVLIIPEIFGINERIPLNQGRLLEYNL